MGAIQLEKMASEATIGRDTKWVEGLRAVAAVLVVTSHIALSLAPSVVSPAMSEVLPPRLIQLPLVRLLLEGRPSVAVFAILCGFVNALKPIQQIRAGHTDAALSGIAKSAFRRTGRFILPAMVATILSWIVCQLGGYGLAKSVESAWIRNTSPIPSVSFVAAFADLFSSLVKTWTDGANEYDKVQWTLNFLLKGSMMVYVSILATVYVQSKYRVLLYTVMYCYFWRMGDALVGTNTYGGMIMAELTLEPDVQRFVAHHTRMISVLSSLLMVLGMLANSYPEEHAEWAPWSRLLLSFGVYIFPAGSEFSRFYPALGATLVMFGILFNATARRILSHPALCRLGNLSFAIYLIHPPLIRTLLTWMLYGASRRPVSPGKSEEGNDLPPDWIPLTSPWLAMFVVPVFFYIVYRAAQLWVGYVDPWCGKITNWFEEKTFRDEAKAERALLMA